MAIEIPDVDDLPPAPQTSDSPTAFDAKAFPWAAALSTLVTQFNTSKDAFVAAATSIVNAAFKATSTSSVTIGAGTKAFVVQTGLAFSIGQWVLAASAANPANYLLGTIASYDEDNGNLSLTVLSTGVGGSGTHTDWQIGIVPAPISRVRASTATSFVSPLAFNSDTFDGYEAGAQAANLTINADAGAPVALRKTLFVLTCDGTARTITFKGGVSKGFKPVGVGFGISGSDFTYALVPNKTTVFGIVYNEALNRHLIFAFAQEA